ncbi:MAG TPA: ATP-binding protein [Gemmatimonadales bacterium]|nr:ATP-binding protein [Gemmatimonadales bacterium]
MRKRPARRALFLQRNLRMDTKTLIDHLDLGVVGLDPDWRIVEWNAAAERLTGSTGSRALGAGFWDVFPAAKTDHFERALADVLASGEPRSVIAPARGPELPGMVFEVSARRTPDRHLVLAFRPVRDALAAEASSAELLSAFDTERRVYVQLFERLPTPALILTPEGQILEANATAADLLGVPIPRALRGRQMSEWAPSLPLKTALRDAVETPQRVTFAIEPTGEPVREVQAVIANVDPEPDEPRLLLLASDVSRELLLQRKLMQSDRLSQLGALVSGVAHELNNPLAAIAAFADVLSADPRIAAVSDSVQIIHTEAMRAGRMIQTLLDFARQRPRTNQAVNLADVIDRVLALHRSALQKSRVQVGVTLATDLPPVKGDPQELQQVLLNAVVNAQQAIAGTGQPGRVVISGQLAEHHVIVTVEDTGPGIPPENLDRVFDPFFTTKGDQGTGLGLAISLGLIRGMGGRIWVQNIEGGGARVALELPVGLTVDTPPVPVGFTRAPRPLSVLIIEDEPSVRRGMLLLAERLGHRVDAAGTVADGLAQLQRDGAAFDALLVDVHLDEAHTGFEIFDALVREGLGRERRVVFTTGDSISTQTRDQLERAARPVLRKPFGLGELRDVLDRVG